jgi:hypothetical protein
MAEVGSNEHIIEYYVNVHEKEAYAEALRLVMAIDSSSRAPIHRVLSNFWTWNNTWSTAGQSLHGMALNHALIMQARQKYEKIVQEWRANYPVR